MEIGIGIAIGVVLGVAGFLLGRSGAHSAGVGEGRAEAERRLTAAADAIRRGRRPQAAAGSPEEELYAALEQGWAPRETERRAALKEAIGRVSVFLDASVRVPLAGAGREARAGELRERIQRALGALEDLNFFLEEPAGESEPLLGALVQRFGARRIMWGSNFPATYDRSYGELVDQGRASVAFLPEADQRWVLGETALSLWPELRPA